MKHISYAYAYIYTYMHIHKCSIYIFFYLCFSSKHRDRHISTEHSENAFVKNHIEVQSFLKKAENQKDKPEFY